MIDVITYPPNQPCILILSRSFSGVIGDWRNHFSAESNAAFDDYMRKAMQGCELKFDFGDEE